MNSEGGFVGRSSELAQLGLAMDKGRPQLLIGDAGIGKTRLISEVARRLRSEGELVVTSACLPLATRLPLLPIMDCLRTLHTADGGRLLAGVLDGCPTFVRDELAQVLPELGASGDRPARERWQQERLFAALAAVWHAVVERHRLMVVIDDVHWADQSTQDFLTYLLGHGDGRPVPLVLSARSHSAEYEPGTWAWLQRLPLAAPDRIELPPLSSEEIRRLVVSTSGREPTDEEVSRLRRRTDGNAFFVEQLLAAHSGGAGDALPEPLAQVLRQRVQAVSAPGRRIVEALAVAARSLTEPELARMTGASVGQLRDPLRELLAAQLLRRQGETGFGARHLLLAEAVEQDLLPGERAELHAAVAGVLADRHEPDLAAEIAQHLAAADSPDRELPVRVEAAQHAERVYAFADAARHWERAVELAEGAGRAASEVADFALRGVLAWDSAGDNTRGEVLGQRGLRAADAGAAPHTRAVLLTRLAFWHYLGDATRGLREMQAAVEAFSDLPPSADAVSALHLLFRLHRSEGRNNEGLPYLHRAVAMGRALPTAAPNLARALSHLGGEELHRGDLPRGLATLDRARDLAGPDPDPFTRVCLAITETDVGLKLCRFDHVVTTGRRELELVRAQGLGATYHASVLTANIIEALLGQGRVDAAAALVEPHTTGPVEGNNWVLHQLRSGVDVLRARFDAAAERLDQVCAVSVEPDLEGRAEVCEHQVVLALWTARPGRALDLVEEFLPGLVGTDEERLATRLLVLGVRAGADLAEAAAARQDGAAGAAARDRARALQDLAARITVPPFADHPYRVATVAEGAEWQAELARCLGEGTPEKWSAAAAAWDHLGQPHRSAYARWRQAEVLVHAGQRREATPALRAAWRQAHQHVPLRSAIENLGRLARVSLGLDRVEDPTDQRSGSVPPEAAPFGLTAREVEVLGLLADGLSNAQIGAQLFISPKTASVHVTAILRKLRADNRVQAAATAQRAGLFARRSAAGSA